MYLMPVTIISSWIWGLAGRGSTNVRLWLQDAAIPHFTQIIFCLLYMSLGGGGGGVVF
jgi:hypothetical protein